MSISSHLYMNKKSSQKLKGISDLNSISSRTGAMPSPTGTPWNIQAMPWGSTFPQPAVMEFNAQPWGSHIDNSLQRGSACKRKSEVVPFVPSKQHITDEKMADYFNSLHITASTSNTVATSEPVISDCSMEEVGTAANIESRLKAAQKITLCEEMKLLNPDSIIPESLLSRFEKPCKALVLWQPLQRIPPTISNTHQGPEEESDTDQENNNSMSLDLNSADMEMDDM